jgi:hypothetical protein
MSQLIIAEQASIVASPASGKLALFADNATFPRILTKDDSGSTQVLLNGTTNVSTAAVSAAFAADTYLVGSALTIPVAGGWRVGSQAYWCFDMTKTAAGTAAFTIQVRMGTVGSTADASVLTLAYAVGSAVADVGMFEVWVNFRTVGSGTSAVIAGVTRCTHQFGTTAGGAGTGLTTSIGTTAQISGTSAGFNSTTQTIIGLSVNGGASFSGTNTLVQALESL